MKTNLMLLLLLSILTISCIKEGPIGPKGNDGITDKQVRLDFLISSTGTTSASGEVLPVVMSLQRFNLSNYTNIDSVIFSANIWTYTSNNECYVELFNLTDNQVIPNSLIKTSSTNVQGTIVFSKDIKTFFPNKEIALGLRLKTQNEGNLVAIGGANLYIYKH